MRHGPGPQYFKLEGIVFLAVNITTISPNRTCRHGVSQGGDPLLRGPALRRPQGHKDVTAPRPGREFYNQSYPETPTTVDRSRILDARWPHIVSSLDASLDLVTTAALSFPAQEANRSASPAHICSTLSPPLLTSTPLSTKTLAITRTTTTTKDSCGILSNSYSNDKHYQSPRSG